MKPAVRLHRAVESHFGLVYSKAATPVDLQGRVTMLANGKKVKQSGLLSGASKEMMLAERETNQLRSTQKKAASQLKSFASSLLSSQRKAASELRQLEQHFG